MVVLVGPSCQNSTLNQQQPRETQEKERYANSRKLREALEQHYLVGLALEDCKSVETYHTAPQLNSDLHLICRNGACVGADDRSYHTKHPGGWVRWVAHSIHNQNVRVKKPARASTDDGKDAFYFRVAPSRPARRGRAVAS